MHPASCAPAGNPQVVTTEADGKRTIRTTGVFSGIELHMSMEPPHADDRCGRTGGGVRCGLQKSEMAATP